MSTNNNSILYTPFFVMDKLAETEVSSEHGTDFSRTASFTASPTALTRPKVMGVKKVGSRVRT